MFLDYDFRHFNFRLIFYMIVLNVIGVLVIRSATNMNADAVNKQLLGVFIGLAVAIGLSLVDYHQNPELQYPHIRPVYCKPCGRTDLGQCGEQCQALD